MKVKKVVVLLIVIFGILVISNNVLAAIPEEMSEEFKSILNEEGKFVITDTNVNNKTSLLYNALMNKYSSDDYYFTFANNADYTRCILHRYDKKTNVVLESYDVEIKYEEKFSDEFNRVANNGNIIITNSSTQGKNMLIFNYCMSIASENQSFQIQDLNEEGTIGTLIRYEGQNIVEQHIVNISYEEKISEEFKKITDDGTITIRASRDDRKKSLVYNYCSDLGYGNISFTATDINDNGTLCTIQMDETVTVGNTITSVMKEQHIVKIQYDKTISENFKKYLNENGKFVIDSIRPNNQTEWLGMYEVLFYNKGIAADVEYLAEDFSSCEITIKDSKGIPETHKVEFEYNYDKNIKEFTDEITKAIPEGESYLFKVKDMELINYWLNSEDESEKEGAGNFDNYSGELKAFVDYKNFNLSIDHRLGADAEFFTLRGGIGLLQHKGITYYINDLMGVLGNHILYVPDDTESTKDALIKAAQKRVDEYAGKDKVKIKSGTGTILEYYEAYYNNRISELQKIIDIEKTKEKPDQRLIEDYETRKKWAEEEYSRFLEDYNDPNGENYFLQSAEGNYWFIATINGIEHKFIIVKDSKSMISPKHKTKDFKTDVEINTDSKDIPLDTIIEANRVINGKEYEKIIKLLDIKENETFDINLFSKSLEKYIKKLDNGIFEVRIPIPEKLKDKKLVVYYVDENDKIEEYQVNICEGYAVFKTNHFSIYTLTEEKVYEEEKNDANNNEKENIDINDTINDTYIDKNINNLTNPSTGDNVVLFIIMFIISVIGIIFVIRYRKENKK